MGVEFAATAMAAALAAAALAAMAVVAAEAEAGAARAVEAMAEAQMMQLVRAAWRQEMCGPALTSQPLVLRTSIRSQ